MPELPEAETIVRSLRPYLEGRCITVAEFLSKRVSTDVAETLAGERIIAVKRHGKQILFEFESGLMALVKLGMTGALLVNAEPGKHTRAVFTLEGSGNLLFDDIRQFGSIKLLNAAPARLGPDPLEVSADEFAARLRSRNTQVKRALLDQTFVRGIGNIYADEALFRAGIDPRARTRRLKVERARRLHEAVVEVLTEAIAHRGSSVSDYVDATGSQGEFQARHRVYRKTGQACVQCGTPVRRTVLAQRGTHYCPACQHR